ncbi:MAG: precorrin-6A reductase [Lachnospiraceae bacterium]|nr:precorrin-6A reductase [Lachnospiraceae bacterium]
MKKILIFAGTTEGRRLSECLVEAGISHTLCVATEYGELVLNPNPLVTVRQGRMAQEEIREFLFKENYEAVIDATHPYAEIVTRNIKEAVKELKDMGKTISYLRLKREEEKIPEGGILTFFETSRDCAMALKDTEGNILLTTGSKELSDFCVFEEIRNRLYVRVLPSMESLSACMEQGICGKQVIAMQGPFSAAMNEAMIYQYHISYLVTKESGISGGYGEKLEAARRAGIQVFVIGRRSGEEGYSFFDTGRELEKICGQRIPFRGQMRIILAGIGMGSESGVTGEVREAIKEADILLGAERMLSRYQPKIEKHPFYQAEQIIPYLEELQEKTVLSEDRNIVILMSGDSGFFSGCRRLYEALDREIRYGRLRAFLHIMPGVSSVSYLAACIGESYHDASVYSMHGKELCNLERKIKNSPKTFLLTSGVKDVNWLGKLLMEADLTECEVITGYQLSYEEQQIERHTPSECSKLREEGLYTCFVKNPCAEKRRLTHGIMDEAFIRDNVPMTKEEVREVAICKLRLLENAVVYDIGSGTGSVVVEIAGISDEIQVYALEKKREAVSLTEKNKVKHGLQNITVIEGAAPESLMGLPVATHAFIGGSGGRMKEILQSLYQLNPWMRIVISAVSLETICEIREVLSLFPVKGEEIVQLQVSRAREAGNYHLMQAENPIWLCSFDFGGGVSCN